MGNKQAVAQLADGGAAAALAGGNGVVVHHPQFGREGLAAAEMLQNTIAAVTANASSAAATAAHMLEPPTTGQLLTEAAEAFEDFSADFLALLSSFVRVCMALGRVGSRFAFSFWKIFEPVVVFVSQLETGTRWTVISTASLLLVIAVLYWRGTVGSFMEWSRRAQRQLAKAVPILSLVVIFDLVPRLYLSTQLYRTVHLLFVFSVPCLFSAYSVAEEYLSTLWLPDDDDGSLTGRIPEDSPREALRKASAGVTSASGTPRSLPDTSSTKDRHAWKRLPLDKLYSGGLDTARSSYRETARRDLDRQISSRSVGTGRVAATIADLGSAESTVRENHKSTIASFMAWSLGRSRRGSGKSDALDSLTGVRLSSARRERLFSFGRSASDDEVDAGGEQSAAAAVADHLAVWLEYWVVASLLRLCLSFPVALVVHAFPCSAASRSPLDCFALMQPVDYSYCNHLAVRLLGLFAGLQQTLELFHVLFIIAVRQGSSGFVTPLRVYLCHTIESVLELFTGIKVITNPQGSAAEAVPTRRWLATAKRTWKRLLVTFVPARLVFAARVLLKLPHAALLLLPTIFLHPIFLIVSVGLPSVWSLRVLSQVSDEQRIRAAVLAQQKRGSKPPVSPTHGNSSDLSEAMSRSVTYFVIFAIFRALWTTLELFVAVPFSVHLRYVAILAIQLMASSQKTVGQLCLNLSSFGTPTSTYFAGGGGGGVPEDDGTHEVEGEAVDHHHVYHHRHNKAYNLANTSSGSFDIRSSETQDDISKQRQSAHQHSSTGHGSSVACENLTATGSFGGGEPWDNNERRKSGGFGVDDDDDDDDDEDNGNNLSDEGGDGASDASGESLPGFGGSNEYVGKDEAVVADDDADHRRAEDSSGHKNRFSRGSSGNRGGTEVRGVRGEMPLAAAGATGFRGEDFLASPNGEWCADKNDDDVDDDSLMVTMTTTAAGGESGDDDHDDPHRRSGRDIQSIESTTADSPASSTDDPIDEERVLDPKAEGEGPMKLSGSENSSAPLLASTSENSSNGVTEVVRAVAVN